MRTLLFLLLCLTGSAWAQDWRTLGLVMFKNDGVIFRYDGPDQRLPLCKKLESIVLAEPPGEKFPSLP